MNPLKNNLKLLNLFLILYLFSFPFKSNAQEEVEKPKFVVGSALNINLSGSFRPDNFNYDGVSTNFGITPYFGWKPSKRWVLGAELGFVTYIYRLSSQIDRSALNIYSYDIGIFGRYVEELIGKLKMYLWNSVDYNYVTYDEDTFIGSANLNSLSIGTALGLQYAITEKLNILLGMGSIYYNINSSSNSSGSSASFDLEINLARPVFRLEFKF